MSSTRIESLKIKAKLLQKAKKRLGKPIQLKQAYEIIAKSAGFSSWRELKGVLDDTECFCPPKGRTYWNTWYSSYEKALAHLDKDGGYLLPYQRHYFICDSHYIESLGIAKDDSDLQKVGVNWVEPKDPEAWIRLLKKINRKS